MTFHYGVHVGVDHDGRALLDGTMRSCSPAAPRSARDLPIPGRDLPASISPWISCRSRTAASRGEPPRDDAPILADGKHVVVIGGGDTGSDCIGTSFRQGALSVTSSKSCRSRRRRKTSC